MSFTNITVTGHGRRVENEYLFPASEFIGRKQKILDLLDKRGLDGIAIYSGGLTRQYACYLTNTYNGVALACSILLVLKSGKVVKMGTTSNRNVPKTKKIAQGSISLLESIETYPVGLSLVSNEHISARTVEYMEKENLLGLKWGSANFASLPFVALAPWEEAFPGGLADCTAEMEEMIGVKNKREIMAIAQASAMARRGVYEFLRCAEAGTNEMRLSADIDRLCRMDAADDVSVLAYSGKEGKLMLRIPHDRVLEEGDTVAVFINTTLQRYNGIFGASAVVGPESPEQKALSDEAEEIFEAQVREYALSRSAVTGQHRLVSLTGSEYDVILGGTGMELVEYPNRQGEAAGLLPGMVLSLSLCMNKPGIGCKLVSENILMTENSALRLGNPSI